MFTEAGCRCAGCRDLVTQVHRQRVFGTDDLSGEEPWHGETRDIRRMRKPLRQDRGQPLAQSRSQSLTVRAEAAADAEPVRAAVEIQRLRRAHPLGTHDDHLAGR